MLKVLYNFRETHTFEKKIIKYLTDEEYSRLQWFLIEHPSRGDIIPGSGGLRKLRWTKRGQGKRGGLRVIYNIGQTVAATFTWLMFLRKTKNRI